MDGLSVCVLPTGPAPTIEWHDAPETGVRVPVIVLGTWPHSATVALGTHPCPEVYLRGLARACDEAAEMVETRASHD